MEDETRHFPPLQTEAAGSSEDEALIPISIQFPVEARDFLSVLCSVWIVFGAQPASNPMVTGVSFPGDEAAGM
jgi:hypothetical protein